MLGYEERPDTVFTLYEDLKRVKDAITTSNIGEFFVNDFDVELVLQNSENWISLLKEVKTTLEKVESVVGVSGAEDVEDVSGNASIAMIYIEQSLENIELSIKNQDVTEKLGKQSKDFTDIDDIFYVANIDASIYSEILENLEIVRKGVGKIVVAVIEKDAKEE